MNAKRPFESFILLLALLAFAGISPKLLAADDPPGDPADWPPVVHILAIDPDAAEEGSDPATFYVLRLGPTNVPLTVSYVLGGTAENGTDYEALPGTVTIPEGAYLAPITVTPIDDFSIEGGETVVAALDQPPSWPPPYIVSWPSIAVAYIEDNDAEPTNQPPVVKITNPPDGAVFTAPVDLALVARADDPDGRVLTVEFFANGTSLGIVTNRPPIIRPEPIAVTDPANLVTMAPDVYPDLELAANSSAIPDPLPIPIPIPINLFRLVWDNVQPGAYELTAVATDNHGATATSEPVEIKVLEAPPQPIVRVRATDPEATEPDPSGTRLDTAAFTIYRTGSNDFPMTVWYRLSGTAVNGEDYQELPLSVTIPEGERTVDVVVEPIDDNLVEGDESVVLTIVPPVCIAIYPPPRDCYRVGQPDSARAVIHDNDLPPNRPPVAEIVRPLDGTVFIAPVNIQIAAVAWDYDGRVVSVEFFEGTNSLGVVTNNPLALSAVRPPFSLTWSNVPLGHYVLTAVATDNEGAHGRSKPVEIKVVPRPLPPVVTIEATDPIASEPGVLTVIDTATFTVHRTGNTGERLLVQYRIGGTADNGVDYRRISGQVIIPSGSATAEIVIDPLDDTLVEGPESVVLKLEPPLCIAVYPPPTDCYYVVGNPGAARVVIRDNDEPPANLPPKVAIVRPVEGEVFKPYSDLPIYATAADADGWVRTVEFFANDHSLGIVTNHLRQMNGTDANSLTSIEASLDQLFRLVWSNVPPGGYTMTAVATDNEGAATKSNPVRIRVLEFPLPPVVTIVATDPYASEGDIDPWPVPLDPNTADGNPALIGPPIALRPNTATFTVRRSTGTNVDLIVYYSVSGTAKNGEDYRELPGKVTIPQGAWWANIVVFPVDDNLVEPTETVAVALEPVACEKILPPPLDCYVVGDPGKAQAYIRDNDFNQSPKVEIVSPANDAVFRAPADIEIDVVTRDPDGWVHRVEFYEGNRLIGFQEIYFFVAPPPGQVQKFSMTWTNVPVGNYVLTARAYDNLGGQSASDPVRIKVVNIPPLPVVTIQATDPVGSEIDPRLDRIPDPAVFTVKRSGDLSQPLRVYYNVSGTAENGVDYMKLSGEVDIPENSATAPIVIDVIDDKLVEGTESVVIALEQLRCVTTDETFVDGCYIVGQPGRDVAYIRDDDSLPNRPPTVAIVNPPNGAVFTAPADIRLVAAADDPDGWVATVEFFANDHSLGVVTNRPWIVEPVRLPDLQGAILSNTQPLPVPVPNPFVLNWTGVTAGGYELTAVATDNLGAGTRSRPIKIKVLEANHPPVVAIVAVDGLAREGTDNNAAFLVFRVGATNAPLTVNYRIEGSAQNGVDYDRIPNTVTIPEGHHAARIRIHALDDGIAEPIETVLLHLQPVDATLYEIGQPESAGAIIVDNDAPPPPTRELVDGRLHVYMALPDGLPYRLEVSTNLIDWEPVISNAVTEDEVHFVDDVQTNAAHRFFRVVPEVELLNQE